MALRGARQLFVGGGAKRPARGKPVGERLWDYSGSYLEVVEEGTQKPPPSFGTPTLAWHLGVWPKAAAEINRKAKKLEERISHYEDYNEKFFEDLSRLLHSLQDKGRILGVDIQPLKPAAQALAYARTHSFKVWRPQSLTFTLWWQDEAGFERTNARQAAPSQNDLRVRVQAQTHLDHATISFFIDAGRPRGPKRVSSVGEAMGERRRKIFDHIDRVKTICAEQIERGTVEFDRLPERDISDADAATLREAADYCYDKIWSEMVAAFGFGDIVAATGAPKDRVGEVFADFRSIVLASDGIPTASEMERRDERFGLRKDVGISDNTNDSVSSVGFGRYPRFDNTVGEPNSVLKSYWPFIRRLTPRADDREFLACGVFDWRALYVTPLGLRTTKFEADEVDSIDAIVPGGHLPDATEALGPVRQLFLTKREPNRQQIGRIVERINAIGTMRMFTLRNWATIRNAGTHIRLIGDQLDGILARWSTQRSEIEDQYPPGRFRDLSMWLGRLGIPTAWQQLRSDQRVEELNQLIKETEKDLIEIGAVLDQGIGQGGSGRLLYVINRSKLFIGEFERLLKTLNIGNIETWVTYSQFVERGLEPAYVAIDQIGTRLKSLRERLQSVTDMVQTGALIVQTEATSHNTQTLRRIATNAFALQAGVLGVLLGLILGQYSEIDTVKVDRAREELQRWFTRSHDDLVNVLPPNYGRYVPDLHEYVPAYEHIFVAMCILAALLGAWSAVKLSWATIVWFWNFFRALIRSYWQGRKRAANRRKRLAEERGDNQDD